MALKILTIVGAVVGSFALVLIGAMCKVASWSDSQLHSFYEVEDDEGM